MYTKIDPRKTDREKYGRTDDPHDQLCASVLDPRGEECSERAEETRARERVSTRKAVRFWWRQVEERLGTRAFECQF